MFYGNCFDLIKSCLHRFWHMLRLCKQSHTESTHTQLCYVCWKCRIGAYTSKHRYGKEIQLSRFSFFSIYLSFCQTQLMHWFMCDTNKFSPLLTSSHYGQEIRLALRFFVPTFIGMKNWKRKVDRLNSIDLLTIEWRVFTGLDFIFDIYGNEN